MQLPPPGALMVVPGPTFAKSELSPSTVCEVTAITPWQLAGELMPTTPSLPVATTTTAPALRAASMADCRVDEHGALLEPRLRLITFAGFALTGNPSDAQVPLAGAAPDDHRIASVMSDPKPKHLPSARTANILASYATPGMPTALLPTAAIVPATCVPCQELLRSEQVSKIGLALSSALIQSPGSEGSASRPSPSLATRNPVPVARSSAPTKSWPRRVLASRSSCV